MYTEIILRFLLAALWGGLVGAERELRSKSAGFRTLIMISLGSCFFTIMSQAIGGPANPDRIAANVVTGIGFLGAGVIFRGENRINGITTAASIWTVSAIGMGIGAGYYFAAGCASFLVLLVLAMLPYVERLIDGWNQTKAYTVKCRYAENAIQRFNDIFLRHRLSFILTGLEKEGNDLLIEWQVRGHARNHRQFTQEIMRDESVERFAY